MSHAYGKNIPTLIAGDIARFKSYILVNEQTGCHEWQGKLNDKGYGLFWNAGRQLRAHRVAYFLVHGQPNPTMHLDHLCRNRKCVKVEHLEQVTPAVNTMRGFNFVAVNARKTECARGHFLGGSNLAAGIVRAEAGHRMCRSCDNAARVARHRKLVGDLRETFIKRQADEFYAKFVEADRGERRAA